MSNAKTLEKVLRLIALSSSPSEEEARTSSVLACRLIREHGMLVTLSNGSNGARTTEPEPARWSPPPGRSPRPRPAPQPRPQTKKRPAAAKPRLIVLNYRGVCATCGNYVTRGSKAWWRPGKGIAHEACSFDSLYK